MCGPPYSCCHYSPLINDVISQIRAERTEEWPVTLIRFMLISPMWDCGPHRDTQFSLLTFLWWWWVSVLNLIMLHLKALMIILRLWNTYLTTGCIMYLLNHLMRRWRGGGRQRWRSSHQSDVTWEEMAGCWWRMSDQPEDVSLYIRSDEAHYLSSPLTQ